MGVYRQVMTRFFEYNTPHIVHIRSKKIGICSRLVQLLIVAYIIGYVIVYKKGYQQFCDINSAVTTKLKGTTFPNFSDADLKVLHPDVYRKVWDVADYVVPAQEQGAFFITTNVIITPNQTQGKCPENPDFEDIHCKHKKCNAGEPVINGNGIMTGRCVPSYDNVTHVCEVQGWCPVEINLPPFNGTKALLRESKDFTVLIKNSIEFPLFKIRRRNILNKSNKTYLESCKYNRLSDPTCPIFTLGTIVAEAGENYDQISIKGGVIAIIITWNCDLDFDHEKYCNPAYEFKRLDDPNAKISKGWNFRYAHYYDDNRRTLYKAFGIRFVIGVHGKAGKFNIIPLMLNVGSGLALLGLTTIVCDFIILNCCKKKSLYYEKKFTQV